MKKSTIMDVFQRDRGMPSKIPMSEEYFKRNEKANEAYTKFIAEAKKYPDLFKLFYEMEEAINFTSVAETDDYFIEGFKIGLLIGIEASEPFEPKEI